MTHSSKSSSTAYKPRKRWLTVTAIAGVLLLLGFFLWRAVGLKPQPPDSSTEGMVWIPGGAFWMGSEDGQTDEKPVHKVMSKGFWMDKTEVTNEQFGRFVKETGYTTTAERNPDPKDFPGCAAGKPGGRGHCFCASARRSAARQSLCLVAVSGWRKLAPTGRSWLNSGGKRETSGGSGELG